MADEGFEETKMEEITSRPTCSGYSAADGVITCYNDIDFNREYATLLHTKPEAVRPIDTRMNIYTLAEAVKYRIDVWVAENDDPKNPQYAIRFPVVRVAELFQVYFDLIEEAKRANKTLPYSLCNIVSSILERAKTYLDVLVHVKINQEFDSWIAITHELLKNADFRQLCPTTKVYVKPFTPDHDTWFW